MIFKKFVSKAIASIFFLTVCFQVPITARAAENNKSNNVQTTNYQSNLIKSTQNFKFDDGSKVQDITFKNGTRKIVINYGNKVDILEYNPNTSMDIQP